MQLEIAPIPEVSKREVFKFLIIGYNNEKYLRWVSLENPFPEKAYGRHSHIEDAFKNELEGKGLPINLEEMSGDIAWISPDKIINFKSQGSKDYDNAKYEEFERIIKSEHPDVQVIKK